MNRVLTVFLSALMAHIPNPRPLALTKILLETTPNEITDIKQDSSSMFYTNVSLEVYESSRLIYSSRVNNQLSGDEETILVSMKECVTAIGSCLLVCKLHLSRDNEEPFEEKEAFRFWFHSGFLLDQVFPVPLKDLEEQSALQLWERKIHSIEIYSKQLIPASENLGRGNERKYQPWHLIDTFDVLRAGFTELPAILETITLLNSLHVLECDHKDLEELIQIGFPPNIASFCLQRTCNDRHLAHEMCQHLQSSHELSKSIYHQSLPETLPISEFIREPDQVITSSKQHDEEQPNRLNENEQAIANIPYPVSWSFSYFCFAHFMSLLFVLFYFLALYHIQELSSNCSHFKFFSSFFFLFHLICSKTM